MEKRVGGGYLWLEELGRGAHREKERERKRRKLWLRSRGEAMQGDHRNHLSKSPQPPLDSLLEASGPQFCQGHCHGPQTSLWAPRSTVDASKKHSQTGNSKSMPESSPHQVYLPSETQVWHYSTLSWPSDGLFQVDSCQQHNRAGVNRHTPLLFKSERYVQFTTYSQLIHNLPSLPRQGNFLEFACHIQIPSFYRIDVATYMYTMRW